MPRNILVCELIVHIINRVSDYDFTHYAMPAIERRLISFVDKSKFNSLNELLSELLNQNPDLVEEVAQFLTVTHTSFFRDLSYFDILYTKVIPELNMFSQLKCWNMACSAGQETYSIAVLLKLFRILHKSTLLGTDINTNAIKIAKSATYDLSQINELQERFDTLKSNTPLTLLDFIKPSESSFCFNEEIRSACHFTQHNIISDSSLGHMHFISCRNVLIYLSQEKQRYIVKELIVKSLEPGGFAMFGDAENLLDLANEVNFKKVHPNINIYQYLP